MDKINTLDYVSQFLPEKIKHKVHIICHNCKHIFQEYEYTEPFDISKSQTSDIEQWTMLLKCPYCDKNWRKTAGICWKTYPYLKKAILKEDG